MSKRIFSSILCAVLALIIAFSLPGCGAADPKVPVPDAPSAKLPDEAVFRVNCLDGEGYVRNIADAGVDGLAVLKAKDPEITVNSPDGGDAYAADTAGADVEPDEDAYLGEQTLYLIDPASDSVVSQIEFPRDLMFIGVRENGEIIAHDVIEDKLILLSRDGGTLREYELKSTEPIYVRESDAMYDRGQYAVTGIDLDTGETTEVYAAPWGCYIAAFDPYNGAIALSTPAGDANDEGVIRLVSLADGSCAVTGMSGVDGAAFAGGRLIAQHQESLYSDDDGEYLGNRQTVFRAAEDGAAESGYLIPGDTLLEFSALSDAVIGTSYTGDVSESGPTQMEHCFYDVGRGLMTGPVTELKDAYIVPQFIGSVGRYAVAANHFDETSPSKCELYIIDTERLAFTEPLEAVDSPAPGEPGEVHTLGDAYAAQRERADAIGEKYGVTILMGDEVYNAAPDGNYRRASFEELTNEWGTTTLDDRIDEVEHALDTIDRALSAYPDGFFEKFVSPFGEGGLRFLIVRDLYNDNGAFTPSGVSYNLGAWYTVEICLGNLYASTSIVHHELWHAIEERIIDEDHEAFSYDAWADFNPEGFIYNSDFDNYADQTDYYEYIMHAAPRSADDVYFVDLYSIVTEKEDRATLIEYVMDENFDPAYNGGCETPYDAVSRYPRLVAKLGYMARLTEEIFGSTAYWLPDSVAAGK